MLHVAANIDVIEEKNVTASRDFEIDRIETVIVDTPLRRTHFHSSGTHADQSYVFVKLSSRGGAVSFGEGLTPSGRAFWGGESVETIKTVIDTYLAPVLIGQNVFQHEILLSQMDSAAAANPFAKSAIDMALHDMIARLLDVPLATLFGGRIRDGIPVLWPLATAIEEVDIETAREKLEQKRHRTFKLKIGKGHPAKETARAARTCRAIHGIDAEAICMVDLNQAWDEVTATRYLPELQEAGIALVEQPVPAWNKAAMSRLAARLDIAVMADEGLWSHQDAYEAFRDGWTDVLAIKIAKGGGLRRAYKKAAVAEAAGIPCLGGMTMESSFGSAASLQLFSALPEMSWGCEITGPLLIVEDFGTTAIEYGDFEVKIPSGPGAGIDLDWCKVLRFKRD